jgi:hypothetical protein
MGYFSVFAFLQDECSLCYYSFFFAYPVLTELPYDNLKPPFFVCVCNSDRCFEMLMTMMMKPGNERFPRINNCRSVSIFNPLAGAFLPHVFSSQLSFQTVVLIKSNAIATSFDFAWNNCNITFNRSHIRSFITRRFTLLHIRRNLLWHVIRIPSNNNGKWWLPIIKMIAWVNQGWPECVPNRDEDWKTKQVSKISCFFDIIFMHKFQ